MTKLNEKQLWWMVEVLAKRYQATATSFWHEQWYGTLARIKIKETYKNLVSCWAHIALFFVERMDSFKIITLWLSVLKQSEPLTRRIDMLQERRCMRYPSPVFFSRLSETMVINKNCEAVYGMANIVLVTISEARKENSNPLERLLYENRLQHVFPNSI